MKKVYKFASTLKLGFKIMRKTKGKRGVIGVTEDANRESGPSRLLENF